MQKTLTSDKPGPGGEPCLGPGVETCIGKGRQVAEAVLHCHNHGVRHRDLKPENIMLQRTGKTGTVKLLDFGLARQTDPDKRTNTLCGSPLYIAPEMAREFYTRKAERFGHDQRVDIWGLGVMLAVLLTGQDLRSLCYQKRDGEFIRIYKQSGRKDLTSYMYTLLFARMNSEGKKSLLLNNMVPEAVAEDGNNPLLTRLIKLIDHLTKEDPAQRISLTGALLELNKLKQLLETDRDSVDTEKTIP